jgi:hypothetical protein
MDLKTTLTTLATDRRSLHIEQDLLADATTALHATPEYHFWLIRKGATDLAIEDVHRAEATVRIAAVETYFATLNKKPAPGVQIRLYREIDYDPVQLLTWCKTNAPTLVVESLKDGFLKAVEKLPGAPIDITDNPRPLIAADLSQYLTSEEKQKEPETHG